MAWPTNGYRVQWTALIRFRQSGAFANPIVARSAQFSIRRQHCSAVLIVDDGTTIAASVRAPGLADWEQTRSILRGTETHNPEPLPKLVTPLLPPTERRRANDMAQLAINVAAQAVLELPADEVTRLPCIFSSADGDGRVLGDMLDALAQSNVALSPTLFTTRLQCPGRLLRSPLTVRLRQRRQAGDGSFAGGLIEALRRFARPCASALSLRLPFPASARASD
jgi:hypothetical protein